MKIKLTSVKILSSLYNKFKHESLDNDINLQKLVNRSIFLYIEDESYRKKIDKSIDLVMSGSKL